jgi:hypothetical protein
MDLDADLRITGDRGRISQIVIELSFKCLQIHRSRKRYSQGIPTE